MRKLLLIAGVVTGLICSDPAAAQPTMTRSVVEYAHEFAGWQHWLLVTAERGRGDYRRSYYRLKFLANPGAGSEHCFDELTYVESCPAKWWDGGFPFYMNVEARVARCGPGWYVVSTPVDENRCRAPTLDWTQASYRR